MLKSIIYHILEQRHFWRYASFSEIAELYASRTLRIVGMNLASGFASVFLYQSGYSLTFIMTFWACFYAVKTVMAVLAARFAAWFGPKHGILLSNILYIPAMISLGFVPDAGFTAIVLWGIFMSLSATLYQLCYYVDFSKVKNIDHVGKEIGYMNILEKIAIGTSPIIGGVIALFFGAQTIMWGAAVIFALATVPLLKTAEQTHTSRKISFKGFPWRFARASLVSQTGIGFDVISTTTVWSLFITIIIFPDIGDEVYVSLGVLSSVTILVALATSYVYGRLIDRKKGGYLLHVSVIVNALVHMSRPFANSPSTIVATNVGNEIATTGVMMAYMRGVFDVADASGHRIAYLMLIEIVANIGALLACMALLVCAMLLGDADGLRVFFFIAGVAVLLVGTAHFRIYRQ